LAEGAPEDGTAKVTKNQPLLVSSHVQGPSEDSGATLVSTQYGSISGGRSGAGSTDWEAKIKRGKGKLGNAWKIVCETMEIGGLMPRDSL
jgi:hypothetical protein